MKKLLYKSAIFFIAMLFSMPLFAQTAGTLTFTFTPVSHTGYSGTRNVLAVWIQTSTGTFVKTKIRNAGSGTSDHLPTWSVNAGGTAANCLAAACNVTDATTGATLTTFTAKTITWDGKNVSGASNGTIVTDGSYKVTIQETWNHGTTGTVTRSFTFTKGTATDTQSPAADANFTNISLSWVPTVTSTAINTGTITGSPFCAGQTGIAIPYTISGTFTSGNVFTAQLSNATGSFAAPTTLGTVTSTAAGTITSTVAMPATAGTAYRIRVVSSTPAVTGSDNGANLTIVSGAPGATTSSAGTAANSTSFSANWTATTNAASYILDVATDAGFTAMVTGYNALNVGNVLTKSVTGLTASTTYFYRVRATNGCGTGANSSLQTIATTAGCAPSYATLPYSTSFETTWVTDGCNAGAQRAPDAFWNSHIAGTTPTNDNYWHRDDYAGADWTTPTAGAYTPAASNLSHSARFHNNAANVASTGAIDFYVNLSPAGTKTINFDFIHNETSATGFAFTVLLSTDGGATFPTTLLSIPGIAATWTAKTATTTATSATGIIRFICTDEGVQDIGIDNFSVAGPAASATLATGTVTGSPFCAGTTGISIPYTATGTYTAGNVFTAQLSNATGSFAAPSTLGTVTSTTSGTITSSVALPNTAGNAYRIRVVSSTPVVTGTDNGANLTINTTPTVSNAGPDQTVCATTATLAGNAATSGTGLWTLVSGTGTITTPASATSGITALGVGANTFRWTISNGSCTASTNDVIITRSGAPTASNAGTAQTLCSNSATLAGNTPTNGTGLWTLVSGTGTITTPASPTSTVTGLGTGANVFAWTISNSPCTASSSNVTLTVSGNMTAAAAGSDQTVCATTATLAGNTPSVGTGAWTLVSGAGTITAPASATSGVTALGVGANTFRWTISNGTCTPSTDDVIITRNTAPTTSNAGTAQSLCSNSATLAGNTPTNGTGLWTLVSGTGTITTPTSPTSTVTGLGTGANVFAWTISSSPCTASSSNVTLTVSGNMTAAAAGSDQTVCATTATLAGNTPSVGTGAWTLISGAGTITTPASATSGVTALGVGANTFRWTISSGSCTPSTDDVIITRDATPTTANAGANQTACSTTATLAGNTVTVGSGVWTLVSGSGTISNASSATSGVTGLGTGANVFQWTVSNGSCTASSDQVTINNNCASSGTITTSAINGSPFCSTTSLAVTVPFTTTGSFAGFYSAQLSDASGSFASPVVIGSSSSSPIFANIPAGTASGTGYLIRVVNNNPATTGTDNGTALSINTCSANNIATGTINGSPFCSSTSYSASVPFAATGNYTGFYSAELSDASGSFAFPVVIGSSSTSPIAANIPTGTLAGNNYRIRVTNNSPNTLGSDNGVDLVINNCPPNSITTGSVMGSPFCTNTSFSTNVPFTTVGNYTGVFNAELSDANGVFAPATIIGSSTSSPIAVSIPSSMPLGVGYRIRVVNPNMLVVGSDNGTDLEINTCMGITTGTVNGSPFCSNTSYEVSVPFTYYGQITGAFNVELSDSSGSFANTYSVIGYGYTSPIHATIPSGALSSSYYRFRVSNISSGTYGTESNTAGINVCGALGFVNRTSTNEISIYPNPNNGNFYIDYSLESAIGFNMVITDVLGNVIMSEKVTSAKAKRMSYELKGVNAGVYFVKMYNNDFSTTKKFVIE